jgi:SNF2 family DNA or RNA helicase
MESDSDFTNFTNIIQKEIVLHKEISIENIRLVYGDYRRLYIIDDSEIGEDQRNNIHLNFFNISKTIYVDPIIKFYSYWKQNLVYHYADFRSQESMKNEDVKSILKTNYFVTDPIGYKESNIIVKMECKNSKYYLNYYLNNRIIKNIKESKRENSTELLTQLLITQKKHDILSESKIMLDCLLKKIPLQIKNIDFNDNLLKDNITLYNYQKADIIWMKDIEKNIDDDNNTISYDITPFYNVLNDEFLLYNNNLFPQGILNNSYKQSHSFKYFGGNIISEVGLGKTFISLYHILSNANGIKEREKLNYFVEFSTTCNYFYKRGKSRGLTCNKEIEDNNLYCKEHKNTLFIDKRDILIKNLNDFHYNNFLVTIDKFDYIKTNSTLIICPNQLCDQWVSEYYSKFNGQHRILLIVTYDQYKNLTLSDILFSDIVVISYNFLTNNNYINEVNKKDEHFVKNNFKTTEATNQTDNIPLPTLSIDGKVPLFDNKKLLNSKIFNVFHLFKWNRIILDESHEIENNIKCNMLQNIIHNKFKSDYKWNVTGTPFPNKLKSFFNLMSYNTNYININESSVDYILSNTSELIKKGFNINIIDKCSNLFRRNLKCSIENECCKNILSNHVNLLTFTNQERSIYDSYLDGYRSKYSEFLIKLCCHPDLDTNTKELIKNCKTFDEIHKCMLDYNKDQLSREKLTITNTEKGISYTEIELENYIRNNPHLTNTAELSNVEDTELQRIRLNLQLLKRKLTASKKTYDSISRTYNYLIKSIETLNTEEISSCPICLDEIEKDNITITKCGHKFCWNCIYNTFKSNTNGNSNIKCPCCNNIISIKDLYLLKDNKKEDSSSLIELNSIIESVKSTKIGNIIHFLKTTLKKDDKVILFSQWDELLHKVGSKLEQFKLNIVYCDGSVYKKKHAISSFIKNDNVNVILLSSRNAASGINLTIANKIILLEPIYGSQEYRKDIESQAIGRADRLGQKRPIEIYRFIIKETIEEDIYNNFIDDNKMKVLKGT